MKHMIHVWHIEAMLKILLLPRLSLTNYGTLTDRTTWQCGWRLLQTECFAISSLEYTDTFSWGHWRQPSDRTYRTTLLILIKSWWKGLHLAQGLRELTGEHPMSFSNPPISWNRWFSHLRLTSSPQTDGKDLSNDELIDLIPVNQVMNGFSTLDGLNEEPIETTRLTTMLDLKLVITHSE